MRRAAIVLLALACPTALAAAEVRLGNGVFEPSVLNVEPGETVTWTNADTRAHTVTSSWDEGATFNKVLKPGESFSYTFPEAGTFDVHCVPHVVKEGDHYEGMVMRVEVAAAAAEPAPAKSNDRALLLVGAGFLAILGAGFVVLQRRGLRT